jgi:hypothetical protein
MNTDVILLSPEALLTSETIKFLLQSDKEKYAVIKMNHLLRVQTGGKYLDIHRN